MQSYITLGVTDTLFRSSSMYEVAQEPADARFHTAWQAAGQHLQRLGGDGINWIRADLSPPLAEHLSFRLGNQLIFVYLEIEDGVQSPSSKQLFLTVCKEATAVAAVMPMERRDRSFQPTYGGWGLRDALTYAPIDPPSLVSDAKIEMSDWEVKCMTSPFRSSSLRLSLLAIQFFRSSPRRISIRQFGSEIGKDRRS